VTVVRYGRHPSQYGVLSLPGGPRPWPVAVVIHGGFWRTAYSADLASDLAEDLGRHGFAVWNLEYRRVGDDPDQGNGGWPAYLSRRCRRCRPAGRNRPIAGSRSSRAIASGRDRALGRRSAGRLAGRSRVAARRRARSLARRTAPPAQPAQPPGNRIQALDQMRMIGRLGQPAAPTPGMR
jgi:hypothetical protein